MTEPVTFLLAQVHGNWLFYHLQEKGAFGMKCPHSSSLGPLGPSDSSLSIHTLGSTAVPTVQAAHLVPPQVPGMRPVQRGIWHLCFYPLLYPRKSITRWTPAMSSTTLAREPVGLGPGLTLSDYGVALGRLTDLSEL